MHALHIRARQLTSAFIKCYPIIIYWFSLERRTERQQERSIRAGDVHSFASAATLPVPEHRADSHDLHRAGSSALQLSGGDTPVEQMRLSSLLVDALASSAGAAMVFKPGKRREK